MPLVPFSALPGLARVWVFGSAAPLEPAREAVLLSAVDTYLAQWKAHGEPLTTARDWRDHRFLAIAVDIAQVGASGCSIDGLFRQLQALESQLGTAIVGSGRVYYRNSAGEIVWGDRGAFAELAAQGVITRETPVFDLTVDTADAWRTRFEIPAARSWHGALIPASRSAIA